MNDLKTPRGWHRDEAGVTHEMEGTVDPITGAVSFPYPPNAAIYTYDPAYVPDVPLRPYVATSAPLPVLEHRPPNFQDLLEAYGDIRYQSGRTDDWLIDETHQAGRAVVVYVEALEEEIERLKAGLLEIADALKELETL
jgi:hypothetical protein